MARIRRSPSQSEYRPIDARGTTAARRLNGTSLQIDIEGVLAPARRRIGR